MNAVTGGASGAMAVTGGAGGMMATGTGGTAGTMASLCPTDPGITMCGTETCPPVSAGLATACVQTCCTADNACGTGNALMAGMCVAPVMNTSMCPDESIMGSMVPGCCVEGGNECGIINLLTDMSCIGRASVPPFLATLAPMNCDGTPVEMMMGTGGMMMGTGGMMMGTGGMMVPTWPTEARSSERTASPVTTHQASVER
jgi:hypothetical protein